jgi:hypothetical protein
VAGALRRHHQHVEVLAGLDQVEVDVEAVREEEGGALFHVGREVLAVDVGLKLVGGEHHDHVAPFGGLGHLHDLEACLLGLGHRGRALAQATAMSFTPESRRFRAWAWPWLP